MNPDFISIAQQFTIKFLLQQKLKITNIVGYSQQLSCLLLIVIQQDELLYCSFGILLLSSLITELRAEMQEFQC